MKLMTDLQESNRTMVCLNGCTSNVYLANELNTFYLRYVKYDSWWSNTVFNIDVPTVARFLKRKKVNKSPGPDNVSGKVLRACSLQLSGILMYIFNMSHKKQQIWKHATVVPVTKCRTPKVLNYFRPVALTSLVMKTFEKIVRVEILKHVEERLDPFQFAYRAWRGVEDYSCAFSSSTFGDPKNKGMAGFYWFLICI